MALLSGFASLESPVNKIEELLAYAKDKNPGDLAIDERYWAKYRKLYRLNPEHINLESGYYNILPEEILEQHIKHIREVNLQGLIICERPKWPIGKKQPVSLRN